MKLIFRLPLTVLFTLVPLAATAGAGARLYVVGGSTLSEIDPSTAAVIGSIAITGAPGTIGALAWDAASNTVFLSSTSLDSLWTLDPTTGIATLVGAYNVGTTVVMHGLEVDDTGQLYGYSSSAASGARFFSINRLTGQATPIFDPGFGGFGSLGYVASTGTMYLADTGGDQLWTIDRTTGATALIGPFGVTASVGIGLAYDPILGMYACNNAGGSTLHTINLVTGAATLVGALTPSNPIALTFIGRSDTPSTPFCFGDGTDTACPCANNGSIGRGCENTFGTGGASISSTGIASISADTLVLHAANTGAFQFGLYFEGSATANPTPPFAVGFGNGLRCVNFAGANRLEIRQADGAGASNTTVALSIPGFAIAGTTYYYQLWYRDGVPPTPIGTCLVTAGFNFSHALSLTWGL